MRLFNRRWWLLVHDCNGRVIFDQAYWTRAGARKEGGLSVSPLARALGTTYEVVKHR